MTTKGHLMARVIVTELMSLDGVIDSPGGGAHPHAGWTFTGIDFVPEAYEIKGREQSEATALLLGRVSYDEFAPVWPSMDDFAEYNAMPKYVVSTTLVDPEWHDTSVLGSLEEVADLKRDHEGTILLHGSATLARGLLAAGLVDRYHLLIFPVVLGSGRRLFDDAASEKAQLTLVEHDVYSNGIIKAVYDVAR
jgi:dihydrofolate reductase